MVTLILGGVGGAVGLIGLGFTFIQYRDRRRAERLGIDVEWAGAPEVTVVDHFLYAFLFWQITNRAGEGLSVTEMFVEDPGADKRTLEGAFVGPGAFPPGREPRPRLCPEPFDHRLALPLRLEPGQIWQGYGIYVFGKRGFKRARLRYSDSQKRERTVAVIGLVEEMKSVDLSKLKNMSFPL